MDPRTQVRRLPERGRYDRAAIDAILDEGLVAHVGIATPEGPVVVPMGYVRDGDRILLHGSAASRTMQALAAGVPACATVTLLDGLVLARSAFHHSMNYRSVVVLGRAVPVEEEAQKRRALDRFVDGVLPGRSLEARPANALELKATRVVALPLDAASAKVRTGPPGDDEADLHLPVWAGVLPLRLAADAPQHHGGPASPLPPGLSRWLSGAAATGAEPASKP